MSIFNKFRSIDRTHLVYTFGVEPSLAIAPLAERYRLPLIATSPNPSTSAGRQYVIRFINSSEDYSKLVLEYLRTKKIKKIRIIKCEVEIDGIPQSYKDAPSNKLKDFKDFFKNDYEVLKMRGKPQWSFNDVTWIRCGDKKRWWDG